MGKRGPPKTPATILKNRGTFRRDRHSDDIDAALPKNSAVPKAPEHLDERAKRAWKTLAPKLAKVGLLTELDAIGMEVLCRAYADTVSTTEQLSQEDLVVMVGENSTPQANPLVGIISKNIATLKWALTQFGLTPASRTGIKSGAKSEETDRMDELLS